MLVSPYHVDASSPVCPNRTCNVKNAFQKLDPATLMLTDPVVAEFDLSVTLQPRLKLVAFDRFK